jgi:hypothetical protein
MHPTNATCNVHAYAKMDEMFSKAALLIDMDYFDVLSGDYAVNAIVLNMIITPLL